MIRSTNIAKPEGEPYRSLSHIFRTDRSHIYFKFSYRMHNPVKFGTKVMLVGTPI